VKLQLSTQTGENHMRHSLRNVTVKFSDLKIGVRLQLGFTVIILLITAHILISHYSMEEQYRLLLRVTMEDNRKLQIVSELRDALSTEAIELRDSIILTKQADIKEKLDIIAAGQERFREAASGLGKFSSPDEALLFEKIFSLFREMQPVTKRVGELASENRDLEALPLLVSAGLPIQRDLMQSLNNLADHIQARQNRELARQSKLRDRNRMTDLVLGLAVIILSVLLSIWISRSITRPLAALSRESAKLRTGDYQLSLPIERKDEVGTLANALDGAVKELEKKQAVEKELQFQIFNKGKLAEVGQLVAGIVHNLKNPLNSLVASTLLLRRENPELSDRLDDILRPAANMEDIITTILRKTREEHSLEERFIDLNAVLTEGLKFLDANPFFKHQVTKNIQLADSLPKIRGLYSDFSQSFNNVIKNALDAMRDSTTKTLTIRTWHDAAGLHVAVADTGKGIDPAMAKRLFQPFQSTKPLAGDEGRDHPGGTGLGLFMVRTLLKRYGARCSVESTPGEGTSFTISLPIEKAADAEGPPIGNAVDQDRSVVKP
jgi:signal transduction histidine kinase